MSRKCLLSSRWRRRRRSRLVSYIYTNALRINLLTYIGRDFWHTVPIPRLGIPSIRTSDGPNGVRGTRFFNSVPAACLPCATALGATFDTNLLHDVGRLLGQECKAKGVHVLLGPTINIQRGPLGGRGFESFAEDPYLSGTLASHYCKGVHEENVLSTPKHFVCNDQEHERMGVNSIVTERALREIYLMPFMLAVKNARPAAVMTAYNKVNGLHASESELLIDILRKDWKWEGLVMSDWFGTYSTSEGINAGQDLEMPGPTKWRGELVSHALTNNKIKSHVLDERVRAVLNLVKHAAQSGVAEGAVEKGLDRPEDQAFLRRVAAESIVVLKNDNQILPFKKDKSVAVIGPNAKITTYAGGGSACLTPYYTVTPFEGISSKCDQTSYAQGPAIDTFLPLLGVHMHTSDGKPGFTFRVYNKPPASKDRRLLDELHLTDSNMFIADYNVPNYDSSVLYVDIDGILSPLEDGRYDFGLTVQGTGTLFLDGKILIENFKDQKAGTAFFGGGTREEVGTTDLENGKSYSVHAEFGTAAASQGFGKGGIRLGFRKHTDHAEAIQQAVERASEVEQVVVVAGLNGDLEGESFDRPHMDLPAGSDELIEAVLAANSNTAIVIQSGTPVTMPWVERAKSVVHAWYGGNETGNGIADVLFGDVNPSGKLSISFPCQLADNPSYLNWGSERGRVLYGEDVYVGYRYYDKVGRPALFPFGHGLSYTTFKFSPIDISYKLGDSGTISVTLNVTNTGSRAGAEVAQVYITQVSPSIKRPAKELKGFAKVFLDAGETKPVEVVMESKYATSFWDEQRNAWVVEKGKYKVLVGNSSDTNFQEKEFEVEETRWWNGL